MLGDRGGGAPTGSGPADPEVACHSVHEPASAFHLDPSIMERPRPRGLLCTAHRIRSSPSRGHRPLYETSDHDRHEHSVQVIGRYGDALQCFQLVRGGGSHVCAAARPDHRTHPSRRRFPGFRVFRQFAISQRLSRRCHRPALAIAPPVAPPVAQASGRARAHTNRRRCVRIGCTHLRGTAPDTSAPVQGVWMPPQPLQR